MPLFASAIITMTIHIDKELVLELTNADQTEGLYKAIDNNRAHLSEFLPWVKNMPSVTVFSSYIKNAETLCKDGHELSFAILLNTTPVGRIGLHYINAHHKNAAVGYWLTKEAEGKGIISKCCKAIVAHGFKEAGLQRIEIKAAVNNKRSRAIPEKLGFKLEGILRQAEFVNGEFLDLALYAMLRDEWAP